MNDIPKLPRHWITNVGWCSLFKERFAPLAISNLPEMCCIMVVVRTPVRTDDGELTRVSWRHLGLASCENKRTYLVRACSPKKMCWCFLDPISKSKHQQQGNLEDAGVGPLRRYFTSIWPLYTIKMIVVSKNYSRGLSYHKCTIAIP